MRSFVIKRNSLEDWERDQDRYTSAYVGHRQMFSRQGKYGKWLLQHSGILRLGRNLFLHAGIAEKYSDLSWEELRDKFSRELDEYLSLVEGLVIQGAYNPNLDASCF